MIKLAIIIILFIISFKAYNNRVEAETSTEFDLLNEENNTYSSIITEANDDNVTDISYSTELFGNETSNDTTLLPTPKPIEPKINYDKQIENNADFCLCDLQLDYCDINCCCDNNCTYAQKLLFSDCEISPQYKDPNYCYAVETLYMNRTKIHREIPENRLFCIVKSNLPSQHIVQLSQPIKSVKNVNFIISRRFKWPNLIQDIDADKIDAKNISSKYGQNIWLQTPDMNLIPLMLPDKFMSNACVQKKAVRFLEDFSSSCAHKFIDESNSILNLETYYKNISFLSLPKVVNFSLTDSSDMECPKNNCLSMNVFLCDELLTKCELLKNDTDIKFACRFSTYRNEQSCLFVTQKVRYSFFYNRSSELTTVNCYLFLTNLTYFLGDTFEFVQHFEVKFLWEGYKHNFSSLLSGNPGYLLGKYILLGALVSNNSNNDTVKFTFSKNESDIKSNFLIFAKNVDGFCVLNNRDYSPVQFGYNMRTNCVNQYETIFLVNATVLCVSLQKQIFHMWQINTSRPYEGSGKYIGMFGNSNRLKISEWTEIVFQFNDSKILEKITGEFKNKKLICRNIAHILSVNIIYAHIDFKYTKHQAKILNVMYDTQLTNFYSIPSVHSENDHIYRYHIDLRTEVMFYDISKLKLNEFAKPPNLQFNLPHDFFYPFMMGNQQILTGNLKLMIGLLFVLFIYNIFKGKNNFYVR